ncbi:photosystem I assembly protein Ycf3 [Stieleria neptunia]|uniref:Photosystem I assembly protein Ycf3 n=1 Tax=Stieleria neptunia TaxID=2527979 RepID=A0A518I1M0_9BACT|nr:tetratricopeptide repeat protein [Stieleria neptunia]QDV46981.1 photosystem I assembly protein Ycf3 [Stieleria neptunia]
MTFQSEQKATHQGGGSCSGCRFFTRRRAAILLLALLPVLSSAGCSWTASGKNVLGAQLHQQGQYTAALQQFQQVVAEDPSNPDGYYNLAATTHRLASQRNDETLFRNAEALYNQCLDHDPNHIECHRGLAVLLMDTGRPDRAFALVKNWASNHPTASEPRVELARLYEEAGESQTALKYLEDAVQLDANNSRAWLALARLRETDGDLPQALQNYQRALALNNTQPMIAERVAALSRQINSNLDAARTNANSQIATPLPYPTTSRY